VNVYDLPTIYNKIRFNKKMNVNDFENEVREKLKTVFPTVNWEFTSNPMAVFDAYAHIDGKVLTAEIKCRQHNIEQYDDCFLEIKKYAELTNIVQWNEQIIYVAHYTNGYTAPGILPHPKIRSRKC